MTDSQHLDNLLAEREATHAYIDFEGNPETGEAKVVGVSLVVPELGRVVAYYDADNEALEPTVAAEIQAQVDALPDALRRMIRTTFAYTPEKT